MKTPAKALQVISKRIVLDCRGTSGKNDYKKNLSGGGCQFKKIKMTSSLSVATIYFKEIILQSTSFFKLINSP